MRATEIAGQLAGQIDRVAEHLLPGGSKKGREWVIGDADGSAGDSLKLCIAGSKQGVWSDFATGEKGDLIGLWMRVNNCNVFTACQQAMDWLGIREAKVEHPKREWSKPGRDGIKPIPALAMEWIRAVRKISAEAVAAYKVVAKGDALMFPYLRDGELIAAKYRSIREKKFWSEANCEPCLFGWQALDPSCREVVIVEGELDALAMWDYGVPALSVPFGAGAKDKQQWIENEYDRLGVFDDIIILMDNDKAGAEAVAEIVKRLGRERVRVAKLPRKDANECLMEGIATEVVREALRNAQSLDPENLRSAADYEDLVWSEFARQASGETGIRLPWYRTNRPLLVLRPGETSLWAGINGHGKSQIVGQISDAAVEDHHRVCIASLEFAPQKLLRRIQCQHIGVRDPSEAQSRMLSKKWRGELWVFDPGVKNKADTLMETMSYAVKRYGIALFVIDNLAKMGISEDEYAKQAAFVDRLTDFARTHNTHCALVHHVRKTDRGESAPPEKGDIKGSGGITDLVDTVVTVWRNKPKEIEIRKLQGAPPPPEIEEKPDAILTCHKQRNGDAEPSYRLWFEAPSFRYHDRSPVAQEKAAW